MIYTKTGDDGTTSLVGGSRVRKDDKRVEAYGTVDELNSYIGLMAELFRPQSDGFYDELKAIQHNLFTLQTLLATEDEQIYARLPQLPLEEIQTIERQIDTITDRLPVLRNFVIAGGNISGSVCHVCRTVCRRAERCVVSLARETHVDEVILRYLNRLSDYLFVLARYAVVSDGKKEDLYIS